MLQQRDFNPIVIICINVLYNLFLRFEKLDRIEILNRVSHLKLLELTQM